MIKVKQPVDGFKTASNCRYPWFCVAVKQTADSVQVRDTKDPNKKTLSFNKEEWKAFVEGIKNGEFYA